jgi:hypothetical protein
LASFLSRARSVPPSPRRALPVIAIGQRVFVNCPESSGSETLFLGDETGKVISAQRVADGLEVEVIAWRPRGANETRYRIRVPSTGADGWLPADNLRKLLVPLPAPGSIGQQEELTVGRGRPGAVGGGRRRFGQHFDTENSPASSSPVSNAPDPRADDRGRRFGQRP